MIFSWWSKNRRDLPWRKTSDPYKIFISEMMLQQTQVSRVIDKYVEFLHQFPTVHRLAEAPVSTVVRLWKGLGYNRRALYVHKTAQQIVSKHRGVFPKDEKTLKTLPGLGTYTARAILVFAYRQDIATVDTNIRQILVQFFYGDLPQTNKVIQETADILVPKGKAWEWHQALMDYGALAMKRSKRSTPHEKKRIPFVKTNRFLRGRILDALRDSPCSEKDVRDEYAHVYERSEKEIDHAISGLIQDGLIQRNGDMLSLTE